MSTSPFPATPVALICHPVALTADVKRLQVYVARPAPDVLDLRYVLHGDLERLVIPAAAPERRADDLWRHTCFEAFVGFGNAEHYYEFNFSPSSEWAAYRFDSYREGMTVLAEMAPPHVSVRRETARLSVEVKFTVPQLPKSAELRVNLAAVIEGSGGKLSYWALAHPADKADFHDAKGFTLMLA